MNRFKKMGLFTATTLILAACGAEGTESEDRRDSAADEEVENTQTVQGGTKATEKEAIIEFSDEDIDALTAEEGEGEDRLDTILERGVIKFGYSGGFAPYNFKDPETGEFTGFETDIAHLIAEDLGVEAEFVTMSFQSLVPATDLNVDHPESIDVALNNHGRTPERAAEHDFTLPYLNSVFGVWVNAESDIETVEDLNGLIAAQSATGSTGDAAKKAGASDFFPVTTATDGRKMVEQGRADFHVMDYNATLWTLQNNPNDKLRVLDETLERPDPVGMAISAGNPKLLNALNKSIEEHTKNGNYSEIYEKYLGEDISVAPEMFDAFKEQANISWD
ncbi:MAG TPA: transporter substrate-binding domain-containing protein [Atopostipes sp.]|nr:transporter substrate-binding domain-containing protein [Atopostipes sp.]